MKKSGAILKRRRKQRAEAALRIFKANRAVGAKQGSEDKS